MIISLLEMQEMDLDDPVISDTLKDSVLRRISAMALVHEHLYSQQDLEYLQTDDYLEQLVVQTKISNSNLTIDYNLVSPCRMGVGKSIALTSMIVPTPFE